MVAPHLRSKAEAEFREVGEHIVVAFPSADVAISQLESEVKPPVVYVNVSVQRVCIVQLVRSSNLISSFFVVAAAICLRDPHIV